MLVRIAPLATIALIALIGLGGIIWHPEGLFNRHSDLVATHLGTQSILHNAWQNDHRLPLWRSDVLSGEPALTNPQSLFTHPVHALFAFFPPSRVVGLVIWLQLLIGALGAYYAAGALGLSTAGRIMVATGLLFSFKTILAIYAGWLSMLAGIAALPLWFGAVATTIQRPSLRTAMTLSGAGALFLHSGNLQLFYYAALFAAIWIAARLIQLVVADRRQLAIQTALASGIGTLIAVGLSAYLLLPLAMDSRLVTRSVRSWDFFVGNHPTSWIDLLTFLSPEIFGSPLDGRFVEAWEYVGFVGGVTSLFALAGFTAARQQSRVRLLVTGIALSTLLAIQTPVLKLAYNLLPGYGLFRLPARILFLTAFMICCVAGIGLDRVLSTVKGERARRIAAAIAIGLVTLEGSYWGQRYLVTDQPMATRETAEYVSVLSGEGFPARIAPLARSLPSYGSASSAGLQLVTGYDSFVMRHYQTYVELVQFNRPLEAHPGVWTDINRLARLDLLAALNVLYVVSPRPIDLPATDYILVRSFDSQPQFRFYEGLVKGPVYVYKNLRFLPRAFFVANVISVNDQGAAVSAIEQADVRDNAIVVAPTPGGASSPSPEDHIEILRSAGGTLDLSARNAGPRFLLVSEVWHPGWSAAVDGHATTLVRADVALLGLWLPSGNHRIEIRFWPPGLSIGLTVTGITILGVFFLLIRLRVQPGSGREREP